MGSDKAQAIMDRKTKSAKAGAKNKPRSSPNTLRLYELEVFLIGGPVSSKFAKKNRVVSRTILIRDDQTLADLHHAIFQAFGRWEEHLYEFQFGKGPMDPKGMRYVLPSAFELQSALKLGSLRERHQPPAAAVLNADNVIQERQDEIRQHWHRHFGRRDP
jgi:Plasmid pRiA4b ORF-3-like protein